MPPEQRPTQADLARSLGVSKQRINRLVRTLPPSDRSLSSRSDSNDLPPAPGVVPAHVAACAALLHSPAAQSPGQAKPAHQQEGPTEYVELVRTTTGEVIELYGSRPYQPPTPASPPKPRPNYHWVKGTIAAVVPIDLSNVDAEKLAYMGYNPNRTKSWF
jgi:hypothetical protein